MRGRKEIGQTEAVVFITELFTEMGWADMSVEASAHNGITFKQNDTTLMNATMYNTEWKLYYNNGNSSYTPTDGTQIDAYTYTIYGTAHGLLVTMIRSSSSYNMKFIITRDEDTITIIVQKSFATLTPVESISVTYNQTTYQSIEFTSNSAINTSLTNFVRVGEIGTDTVCKYAFFMPLYQYNVEGILTINDIQYASNGYWCLSDE